MAGTPAADAVTKLRSVYGSKEEDNILAGVAETIRAVPLALLGQYIELKADSSAELQTLIAPYTDSSNDTSNGAAWPLVQRPAHARMHRVSTRPRGKLTCCLVSGQTRRPLRTVGRAE